MSDSEAGDAAARPESQRITRRIMIVDDSAYERRLIARALTSRLPSVDFTVAPDGAYATQMLAADQPDLVVLDLKMPKVDGVELLRQWREAGVAAPPVIVMTNSVDEREHRAAREAGAVDVIVKPYSEEDYEAAMCSIRAVLDP
jgi:CheY-like chemotaxis protein